MPSRIYRCDDCGKRAPEGEWLTVHVPHPKAGEEPVGASQCPECGELNSLTNMCDEPGCRSEASCGWPTPDGSYRRTCGEHYNKI